MKFQFVVFSCSLIISDETRQNLHDNYDDEFDKRFVGSKGAIDRVPLDCLGPWHQLHWDGHEKMGSQALNMGGVGLPIYAGKDQFSAFVPIMRVIPNVRLGNTIGHFFLDVIEENGCTYLQFKLNANILTTYLKQVSHSK
jgi:hypothetical protein